MVDEVRVDIVSKDRLSPAFKSATANIEKSGVAANTASRSFDKYENVVQRTDRSLRATNQAIIGTHRNFSVMPRTVQNLNGAMIELAITMSSLALAASPFAFMVKQAVEYNSMVERSKLGIASVVSAVGEITDAQGKMLTGQEAFNASVILAGDIQKNLQKDALLTAATFSELADTFQIAIAPGLQAGLNLDQIEKLSVAIAQSGAAIGLPMNQLAEEIRSLLSGTITDRTTRIATAIGIRNSDVREAKKNIGGMNKLIEKHLGSFKISGIAAAQTWDALWNNTRASAQRAIGEGMLPLFKSLKSDLVAVKNSIGSMNEVTGDLEIRPEVLATMRSFGEGIQVAVDLMKMLGKTVMWLGTNIGAVNTAMAATAAFSVFKTMRKNAIAASIATSGLDKATKAVVATQRLGVKSVGRYGAVLGLTTVATTTATVATSRLTIVLKTMQRAILPLLILEGALLAFDGATWLGDFFRDGADGVSDYDKWVKKADKHTDTFSGTFANVTEGARIFFNVLTNGKDVAAYNIRIANMREELKGLQDQLGKTQGKVGTLGHFLNGALDKLFEGRGSKRDVGLLGEIITLEEEIKKVTKDLEVLQNLSTVTPPPKPPKDGKFGVKPKPKGEDEATKNKAARAKSAIEAAKFRLQSIASLTETAFASEKVKADFAAKRDLKRTVETARKQRDILIKNGVDEGTADAIFKAAKLGAQTVFAEQAFANLDEDLKRRDARKKEHRDKQQKDEADHNQKLRDLQTEQAATSDGLARDFASVFNEGQLTDLSVMSDNLVGFAKSSLGTEKQLQDDKAAAIKSGATNTEKFDKVIAKNRLKTAAGVLGALAGLMNSSNRAQFEVGKAAATGKAVVDTYTAATGAYSAMASIPYVGPVLGALAAGAAIVAGVANVQKIQSTPFGAKSASPAKPSLGGLGGASASSIAPVNNIGNTPPVTSQPVNFHLNIQTLDTASITPDTVQTMVDGFAPAIADAFGRGVHQAPLGA